MVTFLVSHLSKFDGQSKAVINFAKGLSKRFRVKIISYYRIDPRLKDEVKGEVVSLNKKGSITSLAFEFLFNKMSKEMAELVTNDDEFIVANDDLANVVSFVKDPSKLIYWSQGALASLFMWPPFYTRDYFFKRLMGFFASSYNLKLYKGVKKYNVVLANSKTSANIISLFYDRPPSEVIYPPLDVEYYSAHARKKVEKEYVLAFVKRGYKSDVELLEKLAKKVRMKVVGFKIEGAEAYFNVPDEELRELYCNAFVTIYPIKFEYFGYIPVESMACGTPVIAYRFSGGPAETIVDKETGWLVNDEREFFHKVVEVWENGYDEKMREKAVERAKEFSIENSVKKLMKYLV